MKYKYEQLLLVLSGGTHLAVAEIIVRAIGFFATIYLARVLGVEFFGKLSFVIATSSYFIILSVLGLDTVGIREIASKKDDALRIAERFIPLRALLSAFSFLMLVIFTIAIPLHYDYKVLLILIGIPILISFLSLEWVFQGLEKMIHLATARIIQQAVYSILVFCFITKPSQVFLIPIFISVGFVVMCSYLWIRFPSSSRISFNFDIPYWQSALKSAVPIGIAAFMITIYHSSDSIMLTFMKGDKAVGLYNAAYKFVLVITAIRHLMMQAMFPRMSSLYKQDIFKFRALCSQTEQVMIGLVTPALILLGFLSPHIISIAYGSGYSNASQILVFLLVGVWMLYASFVFPNSLNVVGKEKSYLYVTIAGALANLLLNFLLIPRFGAIGAAFGTIAAESTILIASYIMSYRYTRIRLIPLLAAPLIAGAAMFSAISYLQMNLYLKLIIGLLIYFALLLLLRNLFKKRIIAHDEKNDR